MYPRLGGIYVGCRHVRECMVPIHHYQPQNPIAAGGSMYGGEHPDLPAVFTVLTGRIHRLETAAWRRRKRGKRLLLTVHMLWR